MGEIIVAPDQGIVLPVRRPRFTPELPQLADDALYAYSILFTGAWVPDDDPTKVGEPHFADLQNLRYTNRGLEGVQGYTRLTTNPLARPALRSGIHFLPVVGGTPTSILLVQAWNAGLTNSAVYQHLTTIPNAGDFETTALWTDSPGAGLGRFAHGPDGTVLYTNGVDTTVWGGTRARIAAFINYDDPDTTFRYDVTERMQNISTASHSLVTLIRDAANDIWLLIGSVRPIQGIRFVVQTANTGASTSTVEEWNGSAFALVAGFVDGTAVGGVSLAQTGSMTFTSTVTTARVSVHDNRLLYFYRVRVGATGTPDAGIQLSHCTVDAPWQPIVDIWDGVERTPIYAQALARDYTFEILTPSSVSAPQVMPLGGGGAFDVTFETQQTAIFVRMLGDQVNGNAGVLSVLYWNGTAFVSVGTVTDGTSSGGVPLSRSGIISWNAPPLTSEYVYTGPPGFVSNGGRPGYFYTIASNAPFSATVSIDTVAGIPAQRWNAQNPIPGYRFPFMFGGRSMLAGAVDTNELHRIDYAAPGTPHGWNGEQSSDAGKAIYVGDQTPITAAVEFANRFTQNLTAFALVHKAFETWVLQGNTPETFTTFRLSTSVGNPAPLSLAVADIPFAADQEVVRTVAIWCAANGPVMSEGSVIVPLRFPQPDGSISSVDAYFRDPAQDSRGVNTAALANIRGWYDPQWNEYNLLVPSGSAQTTGNTWLVADLRRRKWYRKVPSTYPQIVIPVTSATGATHMYGGIDTGHLVRLEFGATWDGTSIAHLVDTADVPYRDNVWDVARLRYIKVLAVRETGNAASLLVGHAADSSGSFTTIATVPLVGGTTRYQKVTAAVNRLGLTNQLRLAVTTDDKQRAPQLLGVGLLVGVERQELST